MSFNLAFPFFEQSRLQPASLALAASGRELSYGELATLARRLAGQFLAIKRSGRIGVLGSRSLAACAGILGAAWSGGTYLPLGLKISEERLVYLLEILELDALVVDARGAAMLTPAALAAAPDLIVTADDARMPALPARMKTIALSDLPDGGPDQPVEVDRDHLAYVEFTSGTTGKPKGVMVPAGAVKHYLEVSQDMFGLTPADRTAETCDITFDLSVHNMFLTWMAGASLHVMTNLQMVSPAAFIRDREITHWLSVPSIVALMRKTNALQPGSLPSLRVSLFCGEPLPVNAVRAWRAAACNSRIVNIYGPTEATVTCLCQDVTDEDIVTPNRDIIALGRAYPGMKAAIFNENREAVARGTIGEIALSGVQLSHGYLGQPDLTAERFVEINGEHWYLTGDRGMEDADGIFHHYGRVDNQVKVLGNRVELEEVDAYLRRAAEADQVAAVAWPVSNGSAEGIVAFVSGTNLDVATIRNRLKATLTAYMVPNAVHVLEAMPLSTNGKVDRNALRDQLDAGLYSTVRSSAA